MHRVRLLRYLNSWSPARLDDRQIKRRSAFHDYPFYLAHCLLRAAVGNLVAQAFHRISIEADQIQIASGAVGTMESLRYQVRSEEHTSELQSPDHLVCRLLLEKNKIEAV